MAGLNTTLLWSSEEETQKFGRRLAPLLVPGDVLLLEGEIGAGKSFLARTIIRTRCGEEIDVPSPTFTLVQAYDDGPVEIWHADLYRLTDPEEAMELGLADAFETAICLVEWPGQLGPYRPDTALTISLTATETGHRAMLSGADDWRDRLKEVLADAR